MTQAVPHKLLSEDGVGRWTLDPQGSTVSISHKTFWGMSTVKGEFKDVSGEGEVQPGGAVTGTLTIAASSIDTANDKRDKHLRSADFFDVEQHPTIIIRVLSASVHGDGLQLQAELTVRGVTQPLLLDARVSQTAPDAVLVNVESNIDRAKYGISWNQMGMLKPLTSVSVAAAFRRAG